MNKKNELMMKTKNCEEETKISFLTKVPYVYV